MKIASSKDILEYIKSADPNYRTDKNVIYAEKAFIANAVVRWCIHQVNIEKINPAEMDFYLQAISSFLQGKTSIYWDEESNLVIS